MDTIHLAFPSELLMWWQKLTINGDVICDCDIDDVNIQKTSDITKVNCSACLDICKAVAKIGQ